MQHNPISGMGAAAVIFIACSITTFWLGLATTVWRVFVAPQMKREQERCDAEIASLKNRVHELETVWLLQSPAHLRQQVQGALSELSERVNRAEGMAPGANNG